MAQGRLVGALFVARGPVACARDHLAGLLGAQLSPPQSLALLAGRPGAEARDRGPTICACFDIGRNEILEAGCNSVAEIGAKLKAGSNCGSCRGEIARLIGRGVAA